MVLLMIFYSVIVSEVRVLCLRVFGGEERTITESLILPNFLMSLLHFKGAAFPLAYFFGAGSLETVLLPLKTCPCHSKPFSM